jgi:hypothetical protein
LELAEVVDFAGAFKFSLYYFPRCRPKLYLALLDEILSDLVDHIKVALSISDDINKKIELFVEAFTTYFVSSHEAIALLFKESRITDSPELTGKVTLTKITLSSHISALIQPKGYGPQKHG